MSWKYWVMLAVAFGLNAAGMTTPTQSAPLKTVALFGDSNTAGSNWEANGYEEETKWGTQLQKHRTVMNFGIGGNDSGEALKRIDQVLESHPDVVTVMFGTNDAVLSEGFLPVISLKQFERNLTYMVDTFEANGINVVFLTTIPLIECAYYTRHEEKWYQKYGGARTFHDRYNDVTRQVARGKGILLVDTFQVLLNEAGEDSDQALHDSALLDESGTHLSEKGAAVLFREVENAFVHNGW